MKLIRSFHAGSSFILILATGWHASTTHATAAVPSFINFETAPVHPIALGPDNRTLAVCNLPAGRLDLFDVSSGVPIPTGSVAVGIDPVTVRFASSNEIWVVNHISSSISVINATTKTVVATIQTSAGPSDLVFAGSPRRAWVSCSRTNSVLVIDPITRLPSATIAIDAERPRAMAASPDGSKVYVAIFESGNGTTILGRKLTGINNEPLPGPVEDPTGPYGGADPPPNSGTNFVPAINPNLPGSPPRVSHIVRKNAEGRWLDDNQRDWTEWVSGAKAPMSSRVPGWDLPDYDLAVIDTLSLQVSYASRLMNICMAVAVNPVSGETSVVGTDATNERRFEPLLNGVFLRVNLALVDAVTMTNRVRDLNPHLDYISRTIPESERAASLGDPRAIEWNAEGTRAYITGMGSRNLIVVDSEGHRVDSPIELEEGPTGIVVDESRARLYVWNRFSSSISVVDTASNVVRTNVPVFDPTPDIIRRGRRHLYDTRKTSGLGYVSCGSCHVDARFDRLAWDLGNPAGEMVTNAGFTFHPMKGPMVTQTLQDIITPTNFNGRTLHQTPLHWRGDRTNLTDFNQTFTNLQANHVVLTTNEMADFEGMLASIYFPPNFYRAFDNSFPAAVPLPGHFGISGNPLPPGNPTRAFTRFALLCRVCHDFNQGRTFNNEMIAIARSGTEGVFKGAQLRSLAEKLGMDGTRTNSRAGFGLMHDGRIDTLTRFSSDFPGFGTTLDSTMADAVAFLLCFTGSDPVGASTRFPSHDVPAATGRHIAFTSADDPNLVAMYDLALRTNSRVELILRGRKAIGGRSWLLRRGDQGFQSDRHGEVAAAMADIIASASPGNEFTAILVPEGSGVRLALDKDEDGYFDTSEVELGFDPEDPMSHPGRILSVMKVEDEISLEWDAAPGAVYRVEFTSFLGPPAESWNQFGGPILATERIARFNDTPLEVDKQRFYRVRKEP